jgi:hypothetical protein
MADQLAIAKPSFTRGETLLFCLCSVLSCSLFCLVPLASFYSSEPRSKTVCGSAAAQASNNSASRVAVTTKENECVAVLYELCVAMPVVTKQNKTKHKRESYSKTPRCEIDRGAPRDKKGATVDRAKRTRKKLQSGRWRDSKGDKAEVSNAEARRSLDWIAVWQLKKKRGSRK